MLHGKRPFCYHYSIDAPKKQQGRAYLYRRHRVGTAALYYDNTAERKLFICLKRLKFRLARRKEAAFGGQFLNILIFAGFCDIISRNTVEGRRELSARDKKR
jgi:hypothetical protein